MCKTKKESIETMKRLLNKVKNESSIDLHNLLETIDSEKQTILNMCIDNNHLKMVDILIKDYFNELKNEYDKNGHLPIHLGARNGSVELFNVLVKNEAISFKINLNGDNPLHIAAENNKFNFIREFLEYEKAYIEKNSLKSIHQPTALGLNRERYTPLFLSIIGGHTKCVEQFVALDYIKLDSHDKNGNTLFHICAEFNNQESLRVILRRKDPRIFKALYMKNKSNETVLHTASEYENLEVIKLVLSKLYDGFMPIETFLKTRNKDGQTFFHIACIKGYFNIVEYFLKDLKMKYLLEMLDRDLNSPLHLASAFNHLSIVNLIIDIGVGVLDFGAKNKEGHSALELSCRKGFFEISKTLINRNPKKIEADQNANEDPLHVACNEGSYEVVRLLLAKGTPIDITNNENKNCLDISIEKSHREVIKVLLKDPNWYKLFTSEFKLEKREIKVNRKLSFSDDSKNYVIKESPQFNAMCEKKMWDLIKIVLDNCHNEDDYEFKILDPFINDVNNHPLTLIAKSGQ
jgi:ankyrin repeat protein